MAVLSARVCSPAVVILAELQFASSVGEMFCRSLGVDHEEPHGFPRYMFPSASMCIELFYRTQCYNIGLRYRKASSLVE
jgi:hypothetical protein